MEEKLTTIENGGWELDDGEAIHQEHPDTFWIPELNKRENLKPDQIVKLIFRISTIDKSGNREISIERMWVIVKGGVGGFYRGILDNDPYCTDDIKAGMEVWFQPKHVISIHGQ